jgi:hypothetical protein
MAEFEGINVTKFDAGTFDGNWISQGLVKSRLRVWSEAYVAAGTEVATDTIVAAVLPDGAVVQGVQVSAGALGGTATLSLGDVNTPTLYQGALSYVTAASNNEINVGGSQYVIGTNANDERILLTLGGSGLTALDEIKTQIFYTN